MNPEHQELLSRMSIDEKIGLLLTVVLEGTTPSPCFEDMILGFHLGGIRIVPASRYNQRKVVSRRTLNNPALEKVYIRSGVGDSPIVTLAEYARLIAGYQAKRMATSGIPLRVVFDQEGGFSRDLTFGGAPVFPKPMGFTAGGKPELAYEAGRAVGRLGRAVGANMVHSPILDVNVNPENPEIYTRAFGDDPEVIAEYALEQARGLKEAGVIATGKHFPGRGDSDGDAHSEIPIINVDYDTLIKRDLYPYSVLIKEKMLPAIMTAHSLYPAMDKEEVATLSKRILEGHLRETMGFEGVITTDAIGMGGILLKYDIVTACVKAFEAGVDMILLRTATGEPIGPFVPQIIERTKEAIEDGVIPESELDRKVMRVLRSYSDAGLWENMSQPREDVNDVLKDPHILSVCQEANHRSICKLRDLDALLPLAENTRALVIEQRYPRTYCPHDGSWYSGIFYDKLSRFSTELSYIETSSKATAEEEKTVLNYCDNYDVLIMTNWFYRSEIQSNSSLAKKLLSAGKNIIILANTPYEQQCIPASARTVLVQFGVTPESIDYASKIIFGKGEALGTWPISYNPTQPQNRTL